MCVCGIAESTLQCPAAIANGKLPLHLHKFLINQARTQFFIAYILGQQTAREPQRLRGGERGRQTKTEGTRRAML